MAIRKYFLGSRYSKWNCFTYHLDDYMKRWCVKTPYGEFRLHHILRSDDDRALHDHPFNFRTWLLTGSYVEVMPKYHPEDPNFETSTETVNVKRRWLSTRWVPAKQAHRLILKKPVWTLVYIEPQELGEWGFYVGGFGRKNWVWEHDYFKLNIYSKEYDYLESELLRLQKIPESPETEALIDKVLEQMDECWFRMDEKERERVERRLGNLNA